MDKGTYIHALDNGLFTLGAPHKEGLCLIETMKGKRPFKVHILLNIHLGQILISNIFQRYEPLGFDSSTFFFPLYFTNYWQLPLSV